MFFIGEITESKNRLFITLITYKSLIQFELGDSTCLETKLSEICICLYCYFISPGPGLLAIVPRVFESKSDTRPQTHRVVFDHLGKMATLPNSLNGYFQKIYYPVGYSKARQAQTYPTGPGTGCRYFFSNKGPALISHHSVCTFVPVFSFS